MNETYQKRVDDASKACAKVWDHQYKHSLEWHNKLLAKGLPTVYPTESIKDCGKPSCIACSEEYNREFKRAVTVDDDDAVYAFTDDGLYRKKRILVAPFEVWEKVGTNKYKENTNG